MHKKSCPWFTLVSALLIGCGSEAEVDWPVDDAGEAIIESASPRWTPPVGLPCASSATLNALIRCIAAHIPDAASDGFVAPTAAERADFRATFRRMLSRRCNFALPPSLAATMALRAFTDSSNGKTYCVLMETADLDRDGYVDRGWGTFIVDPDAARELSQQAPHPLFDIGTEIQAVDVFRETSSRSYLLCGAHRDASPEPSGCQPSYDAADCAHATDNMFYSAVLELDEFYRSASTPHRQIQWHGMSASTCAGIEAYVSSGRSSAPAAGAETRVLAANFARYNAGWTVGLPGSGTCALNATDNVEGRYLNGVTADATCTTSATSASERFIHIEQHPVARSAARWRQAILDTWP